MHDDHVRHMCRYMYHSLWFPAGTFLSSGLSSVRVPVSRSATSGRSMTSARIVLLVGRRSLPPRIPVKKSIKKCNIKSIYVCLEWQVIYSSLFTRKWQRFVRVLQVFNILFKMKSFIKTCY